MPTGGHVDWSSSHRTGSILGTLALPPRPEAWWPSAWRLELRSGAPACQVWQPLTAETICLRCARHRPSSNIAGLSASYHARPECRRAIELHADPARSVQQAIAQAPAAVTSGQQAANCLVPSGTVIVARSSTAYTCHHGPKGRPTRCGASPSRCCNFRNQESFGFPLTEQHLCSVAETAERLLTLSGLIRSTRRHGQRLRSSPAAAGTSKLCAFKTSGQHTEIADE
ncbi:hypothetical protein FBZ94_110227 [Bradyrhizobium sacchari]|uniref:Uncharacterized protein n=1 Tax=Bradyrhizobium sacchari TaxID=1399419 RepID=A0A560JEJ0_9BRAD|nr:hypothetical protein FBZ94_110227 [Bradyrhizobium sacchari]TWB69631.1 hypothetical protein FBZ95_109228 [Bradyrhizobium sacchari]